MQLTLGYPAWFLLLCLLCGAIGAWLLYYRNREFEGLGEKFKKWIWVMATLRFLALSFTSFLLLSPLLRSRVNRVENPIVVVLHDNSESIGSNRTASDSAQYALSFHKMVGELEKKYEVKAYGFGGELKEGLSFSATEKTTNLSRVLEEVSALFANQNLGAIILASDGIYNEGSNPSYLDEHLKVPVYTVGLGDTTVRRDVALTNVSFNRIVFAGDYFPLRAEWLALFCNGENLRVELQEIVSGSGKPVESKNLTIGSSDDYGSADFLLKAETAGQKHFRITAIPLQGEASAANNSRDIFFEVVEKREKILILALAPHPDVSALKETIERSRNYEAVVRIGNEFTGDLKEYSLIVLHQLPATGYPVQPLLERIRKENKSVLFVLGAQSNINLFNKTQGAVIISGNNSGTTEAQAIPAEAFTLFRLPETVSTNLALFPPLTAPFGEYKVSPGSTVLFNQKIGNVNTRYPLIVFQQDLNGRTGIITGEGIWRWRLWNHLHQKNSEAFDALISSIVQYLSVQAEERQFRVRLEKEQRLPGNRVLSESEPVQFQAELLNESNELINDPDVSLAIRDESGKEFPFIFSKTGNYYVLDAGYFPQGSYTYSSKTEYNNKDFSVSGTFSVTPLRLEYVNTRADHRLLQMLSKKTGGAYYDPGNLEQLAATLVSQEGLRPVMYSTTRTEPLIHWRWLLLPLILLLTLEWGIRKYNGSY